MLASEIYAIPTNGNGWRLLPSGDYVKLGNNVKLGNGVTLGDYVTLGNGVTFITSPLAVQGPRYLMVNVAKGIIQAGCQVHTFAHWQEHVEAIGKLHGCSDEDCKAYRVIVDFIVKAGE